MIKTLILCGYRHSSADQAPLGDGLVDRRIAEVKALGFTPLCILAGTQADDLLRRSPALRQVEIAYDASGPNPSLASNLQAGLMAVGEDVAFVLPVEIPAPAREFWQFLTLPEWQKGPLAGHTVLQAVHNGGEPYFMGFPLLVTRQGARQIPALKSFHSLLDPRLRYLHLAYDADPVLASSANAI